MSCRARTLASLAGFAAFTLFLPVPGSCITIRDDQPDSSYLGLAAGPEYASVGTFVNSWGYSGTGILIAPEWVLTAAHNLTAASSGTFTVNGMAYGSAELIMHPGWNGAVPMNGNDFGLVHLSSSVAGIAPAQLYTGISEFAQMLTFVGYGFTGTGLTGSQTLDNQKRAFQNMADGHFGNPSILLGCDFDNPHSAADNGFGEPTPLVLEGSAAAGDSGGGVFFTVESQTYLAGVISFVAAADGNINSDYGDATGFGRVSSFIPWITSTIPEPSAATLMLVTGLILRFARRRPGNSR